jgi:acyl-coenzyme A thioesterase PaaI-like protein
VLTASFNLYLLRPVAAGQMRASGRVVHTTRRLLLAESELRDSEGRPLARGSGSFMRSEIPLTPEIGYV